MSKDILDDVSQEPSKNNFSKFLDLFLDSKSKMIFVGIVLIGTICYGITEWYSPHGFDLISLLGILAIIFFLGSLTQLILWVIGLLINAITGKENYLMVIDQLTAILIFSLFALVCSVIIFLL